MPATSFTSFQTPPFRLLVASLNSVSGTSGDPEILEIEGLFTQGSRIATRSDFRRVGRWNFRNGHF